MSAIIHFKCRDCEAEIAVQLEDTSPKGSISCPNCKIGIELAVDEALRSQKTVTTCVSCGHDALYVQKDFNRTLGMIIVGVGIVLSVYFFSLNQPAFAMVALAGTALVDYVLYALVSDVTVCYSCHAIYRGFKKNPEHEPFDLKKLEKYGGRTPRLGP